ncbi:MAG: hypothetical protein HN368_05015 [Spirochaetales bacterium]|nr:hypothetical protein [Spirochaetales bacterium]
MKFLELKDSTTSCPYLPDRIFSAENFLAQNLSSDETDRLLANGFRHFGTYYFRPVCEGCTRCVPLRVRMSGYKAGRSARRLFSANRDLVTTLGIPAASRISFDLYRKHQHRFEQQSAGSYKHYVRAFFNHTFGNTQLSVFEGNDLVSVMHLDITGTSISAVYCYYDTDRADRSLGTYSIIQALALAVRNGSSMFYLGYAVAGNRHMGYKTRFRPNEFLSSEGWLPLYDESGVLQNNEKYTKGFPGTEFRSREPFTSILLASD